MYNKVLTGILVVLIIAILGTLGYLGYGYYKKYTLNSDAESYLEEFDKEVEKINEEAEQTPEEPVEETPPGEEENTPTENNQQRGNYSGTSSNRTISGNSATYKGFTVVGKLEMPTINIRYPILDVITHANAIEVSIGILYGPGVNKAGNTAIIGHNYNNGLFFGKNKNLKIGDKIYITDMEGNKMEYTIYNKYYTPESDTSWITRQTDGKIEVTLATCDATGANRLIVCARVEE